MPQYENHIGSFDHITRSRSIRHVDVDSYRPVLSEAVTEADTELEVLCGVASDQRVAEEDAGGRVADVDDCVASVDADDRAR